MKPEEKAGKKIDALLEAAGWTVGIPLKSGPADYLFLLAKAPNG